MRASSDGDLLSRRATAGTSDNASTSLAQDKERLGAAPLQPGLSPPGPPAQRPYMTSCTRSRSGRLRMQRLDRGLTGSVAYPAADSDQQALGSDAGAGGVGPSAASKRICWSGRGTSPFHARAAVAVSGWSAIRRVGEGKARVEPTSAPPPTCVSNTPLSPAPGTESRRRRQDVATVPLAGALDLIASPSEGSLTASRRAPMRYPPDSCSTLPYTDAGPH